jgi:hypothetical protein
VNVAHETLKYELTYLGILVGKNVRGEQGFDISPRNIPRYTRMRGRDVPAMPNIK